MPEKEQLRGGHLVDAFCEDHLLALDRTEAVKLARYITESEGRVGLQENQEVSRDLCLTILKAGLRQLL